MASVSVSVYNIPTDIEMAELGKQIADQLLDKRDRDVWSEFNRFDSGQATLIFARPVTLLQHEIVRGGRRIFVLPEEVAELTVVTLNKSWTDLLKGCKLSSLVAAGVRVQSTNSVFTLEGEAGKVMESIKNIRDAAIEKMNTYSDAGSETNTDVNGDAQVHGIGSTSSAAGSSPNAADIPYVDQEGTDETSVTRRTATDPTSGLDNCVDSFDTLSIEDQTGTQPPDKSPLPDVESNKQSDISKVDISDDRFLQMPGGAVDHDYSVQLSADTNRDDLNETSGMGHSSQVPRAHSTDVSPSVEFESVNNENNSGSCAENGDDSHDESEGSSSGRTCRVAGDKAADDADDDRPTSDAERSEDKNVNAALPAEDYGYCSVETKTPADHTKKECPRSVGWKVDDNDCGSRGEIVGLHGLDATASSSNHAADTDDDSKPTVVNDDGNAGADNYATIKMDEPLWEFINFSSPESKLREKFNVKYFRDGSMMVELCGLPEHVETLNTWCSDNQFHEKVWTKQLRVPDTETESAFAAELGSLSGGKVLIRLRTGQRHIMLTGLRSHIKEIYIAIEKRWPDIRKLRENGSASVLPVNAGIDSSAVAKSEAFAVQLNSTHSADELQLMMQKSQLQVIVQTGDILHQNCDVIVSPCGPRLDNAGGLAAIIAKAAGPELEHDCKEFVSKNECLDVSQVMDTRSGFIPRPARRVIHACGPSRRQFPNDDECCCLLQNTFYRCFVRANDRLQAASIAVPAISSGSFGISHRIVAEAACLAVTMFSERMSQRSSSSNHLRVIKFVDISPTATSFISDLFKNRLLQQSAPNKTLDGKVSQEYDPPPAVRTADENNLYEKLTKVAEEKGFTVVELPEGGDSALEAIVAQLRNQGIILYDARSLRKAAVEYLYDHQYLVDLENLETNHGGNIDRYFNGLEKPGTTFDKALLRSVAVILKKDINVLRSSGNIRTYVAHSHSGEPITIGSVSGNHFVNLCTKSATTECRIPGKRSCQPVTIADKEDESDNNKQNNSLDSGSQSQDDTCPICMDTIDNPKTLQCGHNFCADCIDLSFSYQKKCPCCGQIFGELKGDQPDGGTMRISKLDTDLQGYPGCGCIVINYDMPNGTQKSNHPNPGQPYRGARRTAFLPNNVEGHEICTLLQRAFDAGLIFTIGRSTTTGQDNVVTWNDIHHKTNFTGPFGYPDPSYLSRVRDELAAKGIFRSSSPTHDQQDQNEQLPTQNRTFENNRRDRRLVRHVSSPTDGSPVTGRSDSDHKVLARRSMSDNGSKSTSSSSGSTYSSANISERHYVSLCLAAAAAADDDDSNNNNILERFGYPDPTYLSRVRDELASKGVTRASSVPPLSPDNSSKISVSSSLESFDAVGLPGSGRSFGGHASQSPPADDGGSWVVVSGDDSSVDNSHSDQVNGHLQSPAEKSTSNSSPFNIDISKGFSTVAGFFGGAFSGFLSGGKTDGNKKPDGKLSIGQTTDV